MGLANSKPQAIDIPSVEIHDIETAPEKRPRTLKHLLRLNHANHAILYHDREFHNHMPHILGSAYLLGADPDHLNYIYEEEAKELEPWQDSPGEVSRHDWRDYLGDRRYERAFIDFFEDELVRLGYDWKSVLAEYLFKGREPLVNGLISGLGHPLIHLGYAYELDNSVLAIEALALVSTNYTYLHRYLDDPLPPTIPSNPSTSIIDILARVHADHRFDNLFPTPGDQNIKSLFEKHESLILEYWNAWKLEDAKWQFENSVEAAILMLTTTHHPGRPAYDFFLVHLLTTSHAVRILLPLVPREWQVPLVREWWLLCLALYIAQLRPEVKPKLITEYELEGRDWRWVFNKALEGEHRADAHFVKAIRAIKEGETLWGKKDGWYLKAAVKFADEFKGWGGFPEEDTG